MKSPSLIGHESQRRRLCNLNAQGRLPSAIILSGAAGIGKSLVATELATAILCEGEISPGSTGGCGACASCQLIAAGNHPDLLERDLSQKEEANVAGFRETLGTIALKPYRGYRRVVLLKQVERMSPAVANTLLKSLEEPPKGTFFILTTHSLSRVIPTIVSRCQKVPFNELSSEQIAKILGETSTANDDLAELRSTLAVAQGSFAGIESLASMRALWEDSSALLLSSFEGSKSAALALGDLAQRQKADIEGLLILCRLFARQCLRTSKDNPTRLRWATFLRSLLTMEWLILERHINPSIILGIAALELSRTTPPVVTARSVDAIERVVPL